jgi:hypothetical protein
VEFLALLPVGAQLVVGCALFRITQHFVGLAHFLETLLGIRLLAHVRMVLAGELSVGALNVVLGGIPFHAHDLVVVLVFHLLHAVAT